MVGPLTLHKILYTSFLVFFLPNNTLNFRVILEGIGIAFTIKVPFLSLFEWDVFLVFHVDLLLDYFAEVVLESAYTTTRSQGGISFPGGVVVSFALPFDLLNVRFDTPRKGRTVGERGRLHSIRTHLFQGW